VRVAEIYRFGDCELNVDRRELTRAGVAVAIEPKPLEVLAELLAHAGELVTKAELLDGVWAGRPVTDSVIARCIVKLRDALGDDRQSLIQSVHGFGYRYMGVVQRTDAPAAPAGTDGSPRVAGEEPPLRPNFRLLRALDAAGTVWLAQHAGTGERRVLKYATDAARVPALRREIGIHRLLVQALGEREDIARLLDYNLATPPYFVELEYCPDGNLDDWCRAQGGVAKVPLATRLELLAGAAETLAATHALGVLHGDVKPSNLLIWTAADGTPRVRWSDFGAGAVLEPERLAALGITRLAATVSMERGSTLRAGTAHYLAPELLQGAPKTIRSDLYALGVMLYQLVAGDLARPIAPGWEQNVDDELLRADIAAAANDDATRRPTSAAELATRLRTLESRRQRLASERAREHESTLLRQRVEQANARRPWIAAAGLVLVAGTVFSLWNFSRAVEARDQARAQARIADAVIDFLDRDILAAGSPFAVKGGGAGPLSVREAVDRAAASLAGRFPTEPGVEASIRATIGQVYVEDGEYKAAEQQVRRAVELGRAQAHGVDERTLRAEYGLVFALAVEQKFEPAKRLLDEANAAYARRREVGLETRLRHDVINGNYWFARQDFQRAAPFFESALALSRQAARPDVSQLAIRQTSLAWCEAALGHYERAAPLYAAALAAVRRAEPGGGTLTGTVEERYGIGLFLAGRDAEAAPMLEAAHAHLKAAIGDDGLTAEALTFLGWLQLRTGHAREARDTLRAAYAEEVAGAGPEHRMTLRARACLGLAELADGDAQSGLENLRLAVAGYDRALGSTAPEAQLFRLLLLDAEDARDASQADAARQAAALGAEAIAQAAPWQDWREPLAQLQARLAAASAKRAHVQRVAPGRHADSAASDGKRTRLSAATTAPVPRIE
jgi:non-specific serine/threonine protein kinase